MQSDVVIIGGGLTGLATGALLAKAGKRVTVLEKGNTPGGRAYTYEDKGFTLNYGPHAVYRPDTGFLGELMARLGRPVPKCGYPEPIKSYWADEDRFASVGAKPHQLLGTKLFSLGSKVTLARLFLKLKGEKPDRLADDMTWGDWIDRFTDDQALRRFARALGTVNTYTRPSRELSARFLIDALQRNMFAKDYVGYMWGGWSVMYDAFIDVINAHGGALVTGARVDALDLTADGAIIAAIAGSDRYEAGAFVCTLPPQDAPDIAAPGSPLAAELSQWSKLQDVRAACIDLGFNRIVRDDLTFIYDIESDLYYSMHSATAPDLAPAGGQLLHAMAYLSPGEAADDTLLAQRKEQLIAGLDRFFPGWRDAVAVERTLPNARVVVARNTAQQFTRNRVPLRSTTAANLYFAGDGRDLPLNLSELCLASAMEAADAITRDLPVGERVAEAVARA